MSHLEVDYFVLLLFVSIPQQAEVAQRVPGRLRPWIFLTFGIRTGRLYPRRNPWYSFSEAESTPGHMVPSGGATEKKSPVTPPGIDPGTVRLAAQCLNHYATPNTLHCLSKAKYTIAYAYIYNAIQYNGARGGVVVKALGYKPAGRGFDSRWRHWNFSVT